MSHQAHFYRLKIIFYLTLNSREWLQQPLAFSLCSWKFSLIPTGLSSRTCCCVTEHIVFSKSSRRAHACYRINCKLSEIQNHCQPEPNLSYVLFGLLTYQTLNSKVIYLLAKILIKKKRLLRSTVYLFFLSFIYTVHAVLARSGCHNKTPPQTEGLNNRHLFSSSSV